MPRALLNWLARRLMPKLHRDDPCDASRDPLFLFQRRRLDLSGEPPADYSWEFDNQIFVHEDAVYDDDKGEFEELESGEPASLTLHEGRELWGDEHVTESWHTEMVFFTREEADAYGKGRAYNYPEGWQSYSVPAQGQMIDVVNMHTDPIDWKAWRAECEARADTA